MEKLVRRSAALADLLFLGLVVYLGALQLTGNFHVVSPDTVFRSVQLDGQALIRWIRKNGIASVLNLRGDNTGTDWHEAELAVTDRLGIQHIDFRMSASPNWNSPKSSGCCRSFATRRSPF
ncbi:hypothetical protein [Palleronia abyssalis]|mgnify:CR=1 FL=1|uniref:Uncharacterized protein n=1 Tax=Palleronia abyssalis TaxID=1501240 RepID=A0A2R8BS36_9RHOB|nr:hypothetical protein [Palleronia abyssalis]SPJ22979.1 hypothetical protein PAA8504_00780 [Palleronia abyssalis]